MQLYINDIKYSVEGPDLKPDFHFLIPELVIGSSMKIVLPAGFDAIAQAIESLIKTNSKSVEFSKSLKISIENFLNFSKKTEFRKYFCHVYGSKSFG